MDGSNKEQQPPNEISMDELHPPTVDRDEIWPRELLGDTKTASIRTGCGGFSLGVAHTIPKECRYLSSACCGVNRFLLLTKTVVAQFNMIFQHYRRSSKPENHHNDGN